MLNALLSQASAKPSHPRIASVAKVSERSIGNVIRDLRDDRLVLGGHPARLGPGLGTVLAFSIGSETLRAGLVDANGEVHCKLADEPDTEQLRSDPARLLARIRLLGSRVLELALDQESLCVRPRTLALLGLSSSWAAPIDRDGRPRGLALRHPEWRRSRRSGRVPTLPDRLSKVFGQPFAPRRCHALNDANAHAIANVFDQTRARFDDPAEENWRVALSIRIGGGVGAGTVLVAPHTPDRLSFIDSKLIVGTKGFAGELGHSPVGREVIAARNKANPFKEELARLDYDGAECSCGGRHHLEAFAGGKALIGRLRESGYAGSGGEVDAGGSALHTELASEPDEIESHALNDVGRIIGSALANPILMLNPHSITLSGSLALEDVCRGIHAERESWRSAIDDSVEVDYLRDPNRAFVGVRGAALVIIRRSVYRFYLQGKSWDEAPLAFGDNELGALNKLVKA